jgi:hypothetical protein
MRQVDIHDATSLSVQQENLGRHPKEAVRAAIRALELQVEMDGE